MFEKKRVLIFIDWFLPGYKGGGPIRSIANLIRALDSEIDFSIVTRNTDAKDSDEPHPKPYKYISSDEWTWLNHGVRILYLSKAKLNYKHLRRIIEAEKFDFLYLNGIYSLYFAILPLIIGLTRRRSREYEIVVAPRGSLQAGAVNQKKAKKLIFLSLLKRLKFANRVVWQATDKQEREDIKNYFGENLRIREAQNLPEQNQTEWIQTKKTSGSARFYFASRISPKKNLTFFLELLNKVSGKVVFDIYGPLEDAVYVQKCSKIIERLPANVEVVFKGAVSPARLNELTGNYHFSVLTTRGENFGHSIFESFIGGKPVLLSDQTPWRDLSRRNLGWDVSLDDVAAFERAIKQCVEMDQAEYDLWSKAAWNFAAEFKNDSNLLEQSRQLFAL